MLKIRALNESSSSSEEEDEDNPRLSAEAQEAQAKILYDKAQRLTINQDYEKAVETFAEVLQLPYLTEFEKKCSPVQLQLRLGCLKCLSTLYTRGSTKNLKDAACVLERITELEPKNVNFWYRLGKVALEMRELELAFDAFKSALDCSPGHWGSIEQLVTVSFALHDILGCLRFCAIGLSKDPAFLKGHVFKNQVFKQHSWVEDAIKGNNNNNNNEFESLFSDKEPPPDYLDSCGQKYLSEVRELIVEVSQKKATQRKMEQDEMNKPIKCPFTAKSFTLTELGKVVFEVYKHVKDSGTLLRPVDIFCAPPQTEVMVEEEIITSSLLEPPVNTIIIMNGDCCEEPMSSSAASVCLRSRSTSDDKESILRDNNCTSGNDSSRPANDNSSQLSETDDKMGGEEDSQTVEQLADEENSQRKNIKNKKDVKWWQIEGQRRSQRVRGNLVATPVKAKPENTFEEILRNIIPEGLLTEEHEEDGKYSKKSKNNYHSAGKSSSSGVNSLSSSSNSCSQNHSKTYFGSNEEIEDVKMLLNNWKSTDILRIITHFIRWISKNCNKSQWPADLRDIFLKLYDLYRNSVSTTFEYEYQGENNHPDVEDDIFTILVQAELSLDSNLATNNHSTTNISLLDNAAQYLLPSSSPCSNKKDEFLLRLEWLKFKTHCQQCRNDLIDHTYTKLHLDLILNILKGKPDDYFCILPTEHDSVISSNFVQEKLLFFQKIENLSKIEELYQAKQFQDLVEILQFSLSSSTSSPSSSTSSSAAAADSPDDFQNRLYLTESYYQLGNVVESVNQCDLLLKSVLKNGSEEQLIAVLKLLHNNIYDEMKDKMTTTEFKKIINMLTKTLIQVEKQDHHQCSKSSFIMTDPWCFLHKVLYHMEQIEESTFDEDSVPGSILILQLGHEILSKIGKCSNHNGHFLSYSINALLEMESSDFYSSFEETKACLDQAILCLYGHPNSKKFKLKNLKDHGTTGIPLTWAACCQLYDYYKLEELPEFDSKPNKSISAEVENFFQRIISKEMPTELKPEERYHQMKEYVKGSTTTEITQPFELQNLERLETFDIYYLLADFYFKNQDLNKAVEFYIWDLAVCPMRFDSWTAIALTKVEDIVAKINACDAYKIEEIMTESEAVIRCFNQSINLDLANTKVRIEFGSLLYSLHSVFSRELKFHASKINPNIAKEIEERYSTYLVQSQSLFEPYKGGVGGIEEDEGGKVPEDLAADEDDAWINHYMLGKVAEKTYPTQPEKFLSQYALASQLLHAKCSVYPSKINYYNPQDYALEALEVYFRIHASILSYIQKVQDHNKECEDMLLKFLKSAEESPFITSKQGRATAAENGEAKKRKRLPAGDTVSKEDKAVINTLMDKMLDKVVKMTSSTETPSAASSLPSSLSNSSTETSSSSDEDSNANPPSIIMPPSTSSTTALKNLSLSSFRDRLREEEEAASKLRKIAAAAAATSSLKTTTKPQLGVNQLPTPPCPSTIVEKNSYVREFGALPYGLVIAMCLKAMKECVSRCPQYFKAYYRLAHAFVTFRMDYRRAREYLMGNNFKGASKVAGLYGERKPNNFFNGIWRHPIEDIDRPGSFAFYMSKSMQLLLKVLCELKDHKTLADVGIQLAKVPDSKNTYLYTEDREQYSINAFKMCEVAARKSIPKNPTPTLLLDCGMAIYDTYTKFQKFNSRENNVAPVLLEVYKHVAATRPGMGPSDPVLGDAVRFFQHILWSRTATGTRNIMEYPPSRQPATTTMGSGANFGVPTSIPNSLTNSEKLRKPIQQRQPSDVQREMQATPYTVPAIVPNTLDLNFNSSNAAAELILAAQLAQYNNVLQQQFNNYLSHQSAVDAINSNNMAADNTINNNNKQNQSSSTAKSSSSSDIHMKKMQRNSLKFSNPFHSPLTSIREQIMSNLTNSMNRKASIERLKAIKHAQQRRVSSGTVSSSSLPKPTRKSFPHYHQSTASNNLHQQGRPIAKNRNEAALQQQQQMHSDSNMINSSSFKKDFPNISCTKVNTTSNMGSMLPKLKPKPEKSSNNHNGNSNVNNNNTSSQQQKPKSNLSPQSMASSSPYLSSSPFQVQATAMTNPSLSGKYSPMSKNTLQQNSQSNNNNNNNNSPSPQPAHSQAVTQPRYSVNSTLPAYSQPNQGRIYPRLTSSAPQPEVVDLTTKSPDKTSTNQSSQQSPSLSTNSGLNITRTFDTSVPNLQQHYIDTSNTSVTLTKVSSLNTPRASSSISSGHLMPWDMKKSHHQEMLRKSTGSSFTTTKLHGGEKAQIISRNSKSSSSSLQFNNKSPSSFAGGNNSTLSTGFYKSPPVPFNPAPAIVSITPIRQMQQDSRGSTSSQGVPAPKVLISKNYRYPSITQVPPTSSGNPSRPLKRPLQMTDHVHHYPLPPKKKHHIIPASPPPAEPDVEEEVVAEQDTMNISSPADNCDIPPKL